METNEPIVMVELHPSKHRDYIQLVVKSCPFCHQRHNHGIGEGWRLSHCYDKKTGERIPSGQYNLQIDWSVPAHAKLKARYDKLYQKLL